MSEKMKILGVVVIGSIIAGTYFITRTNKVSNISPKSTVALVSPAPLAKPISETILQTIPELTTPMVWTAPAEGTLMNAAGDEVPGTLISSKVATKEANKFAGLLVTDTPLVKQYGWAEDPSGIADGMGESIHTYVKNNQKLIIRYKGGEYKVLLSK